MGLDTVDSGAKLAEIALVLAVVAALAAVSLWIVVDHLNSKKSPSQQANELRAFFREQIHLFCKGWNQGGSERFVAVLSAFGAVFIVKRAATPGRLDLALTACLAGLGSAILVPGVWDVVLWILRRIGE